MTEFLTNNSIYIVLIITLIIWFGLAFLIFNLDSKVKKLENSFNNSNEEKI
ncbi:CcmD family protein [Bacteroidetes/Chlorobi group bacterium ChocPot_Mid]|jgi:hypothetical protein|nr:MAG: CcmD family protein [Bacteroidetes/Chlorobi group bacterium ChocPot_Mid]